MKFVAKFVLSVLALLCVAVIAAVLNEFVSAWLFTQSWYTSMDPIEGSSSSFDAEWFRLALVAIGIKFSFLTVVCLLDALIAASLDLKTWWGRVLASSVGTVLLVRLDFGIFAPSSLDTYKIWIVNYGFHVFVMVAFFLALTALVRIDRRICMLWMRKEDELLDAPAD